MWWVPSLIGTTMRGGLFINPVFFFPLQCRDDRNPFEWHQLCKGSRISDRLRRRGEV